jgi:hypothetical protein
LDPLDANFIKKNHVWVVGSNSSGGRLTLVNSSLSSLPSYFMSLLLLNNTFLEKWINIGAISFGMGRRLKKIITWLNGVKFADARKKII